MSQKRRIAVVFLVVVLVTGLVWLNWKDPNNSASKPPGSRDGSRLSSSPATTLTSPDDDPLYVRTVAGTIDLSTPEPYAAVSPEFQPVLPANPNDRGVYYVQFDRPITRSMKEGVQAAGAELLEYTPDLSFTARIRHGDVPAVRRVAEVRAVAPKAPIMNIGPQVQKALKRGAAGDPISLRVAGYPRRPLNGAQFRAAGFPLRSQETTGTRAVRMTTRMDRLRKFLPALAARTDVAWIQVDFQPRLSSPPDLGAAKSMGLMNDEAAGIVQGGVNTPPGSIPTPIWDAGVTGAGQRVCVTDSGCDEDHGMFYDPVNGLVGIDTINNGQRKIVAYLDLHGTVDSDGYDHAVFGFHGTHVCGTVAGYFHGSSPGDNTYKGMAYDAKLVLNDIGVDNGSLNFGAGGVPGVMVNGIGVGAYINSNSWGSHPSFGYNEYYDSVARDLDLVVNDYPALLIVFAAGNKSLQSGGSVSFEANAKNVLVVGATGDGSSYGDGNDHRAYFSSNGPTGDGRYRPHVMAPGYPVRSASGDATTDDSTDPATEDNHGTKNMSGTSMATPVISGAGALVRQYFADDYFPAGSISTPSAALLKAMLINSAVDLVGGNNGSSGTLTNIPNNEQGWGRVQLDQVLDGAGSSRNLTVVDNTAGLNTGESVDFTVTANTGQALRVSLVWSDVAAAGGASPALVNDLNLSVTAPDAGVYLGNRFAGGLSATGGSADTLNTEENVYLIPGVSGEYTIRVAGYNVPVGPQDYALVVSGSLVYEPEIEVAGNGNTLVSDASNTPSTTDNTKFAAVDYPGETSTQTFAINNHGLGELAISGISFSGAAAGDFSVDGSTPTSVNPGSSVSFDVLFNPAALGLREARITITSDDADEASYSFNIEGKSGRPEIDLQGNGVSIADGDLSPTTGDGTDYGLVDVSKNTPSHVFTIVNDGSDDLTIFSLTKGGDNPADFIISGDPTGVLVPDGTADFTVTFDPVALGMKTATLTISNDDADESSYVFKIQATADEPAIAVYGNTNLIPNDVAALPSDSNGTDFGLVRIDQTKTMTYTIENLSSLTLDLNTLPGDAVALTGDTANFTIVEQPATSVAPGGSTTFRVQLDTDEIGTVYTAVVSILSDDPDDTPYTYTIVGTGHEKKSSGTIISDSGGGGGCNLAAVTTAPLSFYLVILLPMGLIHLLRRRLC